MVCVVCVLFFLFGCRLFFFFFYIGPSLKHCLSRLWGGLVCFGVCVFWFCVLVP